MVNLVRAIWRAALGRPLKVSGPAPRAVHRALAWPEVRRSYHRTVSILAPPRHLSTARCGLALEVTREHKKNIAGLVLRASRPHIGGMAPRRAGASYVFKLSRPASGAVQIASSIIRAPFASHAGGVAAIRQYHIARCVTVYTTTSKTNAHRRTAGAEMLRVSALTQCSVPTRGGPCKTSSTSPPRT